MNDVPNEPVNGPTPGPEGTATPSEPVDASSGETVGAAGGPSVDPAVAPPNDTPAPARSPRNALIAAAVAAVVAVIVGVVAFGGGDAPAEPARSTTSTSAPTTTTTSVPALPGGTFEIATAKATVPLVTVTSVEPAGWSTTPLSVTTETPPLPPASQDTVPARDALPRIDYPIQGRYAIENGWEFANPGPYTDDQPFTMAVTERRGDWVKVQLPVRPNGTEGWVPLAEVDISTTTHRIEIHLGEHRLRAYDDTAIIADTPVVIGSSATPTPTGRFYVTDLVPQSNPAGAYGPIALATDGYSEVMDEFSTGVPVVALHGTNRPELVGQSVSNGCIRIPNDIVTMLADTIPLGTPVFIWP
ncbi:MAG: L,D-transpeptidase family protein [Actinomycetota bacterium]|nr:L,D-transpeptidase family protein [Actinomycetota bacterium]